MRFLSYKDPAEHTKEQIKKVRSHPWIAKEVPVRGFIFDVWAASGSDHRRSAKRRSLKDDDKFVVPH